MDKKFFEKYVERFPGLYLYLSNEVDEPHDYGIGEESSWAEELYKIMEVKHPEALEKIDHPLKKIAQSISPNRRGIELERTMMNLIVLNAIVEDNYEFFRSTPVAFGKPISHDQFNHLRSLVLNNFPGEKLKLLECELILGDYGKVASLRKAVKEELGLDKSDPDDFMSSLFLLEHSVMGRLFPGIEALDRKEYFELREIKTGFHFGHMAQGEMSERELELVKDLMEKHKEHYLYENFVVQLIDVAGAMGHINGRIMLNQEIFEVYVDCVLPSLEMLKNVTAEEAYHNYLYQRAAMANLNFSAPIEMSWSETFSLRILCLMRITHENEARDLFDVLDVLWLDERFTKDAEYIITYQKQYETPTYTPALFHTLRDHFAYLEYTKKILGESVKKGVHIIAASLKLHKKLIKTGHLNEKTRVNFNEISKILRTHPEGVDSVWNEQDVVIRASDVSLYPRLSGAVEASPSEFLDYLAS